MTKAENDAATIVTDLAESSGLYYAPRVIQLRAGLDEVTYYISIWLML